MSFHTQVSVHPFDGEPLNVASVREELLRFLDEYSLSHDVLTNLTEACGSALPTSTLFFLNSMAIVMLFDKLASCLPNASFAVKGSGEDHRDIWVREYADGVATFEAGPFDE
ncbi:MULTISPECIES: hypothetical protein [Burkholderia]|uniref:hypothetical protein n=1 Tax=Burkholderia TaxID=32008 RepID=UPI0004F92810|nr:MULTISPECIES: hypothetical protein [Burkholderia]AIO25449.1 hypothetical protein DM41_408 [Burkholderia cepacia ATCC 25416]ALK19395.1 hypothetical protein APZ15_17175 [Burkholderia cepacia ATCC 25416]KML14032.1 hypothetical protein VL00_19495 [Burkholderia cepacia]KML38187.1 hypothetical protein VL13_22780 [Burkholderia lata]KMN55257.1 hypothetical protein VK92_25250 [Burkholderia sp. LK4]